MLPIISFLSVLVGFCKIVAWSVGIVAVIAFLIWLSFFLAGLIIGFCEEHPKTAAIVFGSFFGIAVLVTLFDMIFGI